MNYIDFTAVKTANFADRVFDCSCGRRHAVSTKEIIIGVNALSVLKDTLLHILPAGKVLFVSAVDIMQKGGNKICDIIKACGYSIYRHIYPSFIKPDVKNTKELFQYSEDVRLVIAYGSGSLCDIVKYYCTMSDVKLIMIPSAPSTDGYLSCCSYLYFGSEKRKIKTKPPYAFVCDLALVLNTPDNMRAAGLGEICSKITSLADWYYEKCLSGAYYCKNIVALIKQSINICINEGEGLINGNARSIYMLTDALLRCSIAMQLLDDDICSYGGEHFVAELTYPVDRNGRSLLCGEKVFLVQGYILKMYKMFFENKFTDVLLPVDKALHAQRLSKLGGDYFSVLSKFNYDISAENYKLKVYKTDEFRDDFIKLFSFSEKKSNTASVIFKRMYGDAGYSISGVANEKELKTAIALGADLSERYTILSHMRNMGLFEKYLR